ncbi:MAG: diguanylate cyclase, partial [Candidatus Zixiibacteriota bacterium]
MPNTANTIRESWPASSKLIRTPKRAYHFAVCQEDVSLDFHLERFFQDLPLSFHFFKDIDELIQVCRRHAVDAIIIGGRSDFYNELRILRAIKQNVFMSIIPVILYHPDPPTSTVVAAYENGADDFIRGDWLEKLVEVRIRRVINRSQRDLGVNPSTRLPGPALIEQEVDRQIKMGSEFAVCYADLDNFKAYNDYYGYTYG